MVRNRESEVQWLGWFWNEGKIHAERRMEELKAGKAGTGDDTDRGEEVSG